MNEARSTQRLDVAELYFVLARFLEQSPCQEAAKVLQTELTDKKLLPRGKTWEGADRLLTYQDVITRNPHITPDFFGKVCTRLCESLDHAATRRAHSLLGGGLASCVHEGLERDKQCTQSQPLRLGRVCSGSFETRSLNTYSLLTSRQVFSTFRNESLQGPQLYTKLHCHCTILGHLAPVFCVLFDRTGQRIITGADDDLLKVWSASTGQLHATFRGHTAEITDMTISCDNSMIASGSLDKTVRVWCAHSATPIAVLSGHAGHITSVRFSPSPNEDARYVASTGKDGCLCFWKWDPEKSTFNNIPVKFMEKNRMGDQTLCSAFSSGGTFFVTGGTDKIIRVYKCIPYPPVLVAEVQQHQERIMTVQFSHTPQCLFATGSCDGTACIWRYHHSQWKTCTISVPVEENGPKKNIDTGKVEKPQVTMVEWERTDTYLVSAHSPDCIVRVWRSSTGELVSKLKEHTGEVFVLECHPHDSRVLLTAGHDGLIMIWDMLAAVELRKFKIEHEGEGISCIFDCKWSPDGFTFAAADSHGYLTVYGLGSSKPYEQFPDEQFFHTDYRPLMQDRNHFVVDEQSQLPPHLLPPPYLVDVDGHPHPSKYQEGILKLIRPAKRDKLDWAVEELEDYDSYMQRHSAAIRNSSGRLGQNRSIGGRERGREDNQDTSGSVERENQDSAGTSAQNGTESAEASAVEDTDRQAATRAPTDDVDVMEEEEGDPENIQNMLSSIVYSLGLTQEEAQQAISYWHSRMIVPQFDPDHIGEVHSSLVRLYEDEEELYQTQQLLSDTPPPAPSPKFDWVKGRSLRSGRTLPDPLASVVVESDSTKDGVLTSTSEMEEEVEIEEDNWEMLSTASSDISDWTTEVGMNFISPSRKRSKRRRRQYSNYSDESSEVSGGRVVVEDEEERDKEKKRVRKKRKISSDEQDEPVKERRKSRPSLPVKGVDLTAYWPSDWLKSTKPRPSPYFPQVGDIVVYCRQGHELYRDAVRENKAYPWKHQRMPWEKFTLRPQEFCQVKNVHFVVGPPTLCSITLALLSPPISDAPCSSQQAMATNQFHDMDNVLDFIILEQVYKDSLKQQWSVGDRFRSLIDDQYWFGTILKRRPFSEDAPNSVWQSYHIRWDDGATDQLSPWDLHPLETDNAGTVPESSSSLVSSEDLLSAWDKEGEKERILRGLDAILEKEEDELEEADMFLDPVDLDEEPTYCTVVPFPTSVFTIAERMRNGFYRRKIALIWEVVLLARNALAYNEENSLIVRHGKIFVQTLLKFIRSSSCNNIMECHHPDLSEADDDLSTEVIAPEVELVEAEEVFTAPEANIIPLSPTKRKSKRLENLMIRNEEEEEEKMEVEQDPSELTTELVNSRDQLPWFDAAVQLLDHLCRNENSPPFLLPVDTEIFPDYPLYVCCPMDLSLVRQKLSDGRYRVPRELIDDVRLIFTNAKEYNQQRSQVYKMAKTLQAFFEIIVLDFLKSCQAEDKPVYGTRRTLGILAESTPPILRPRSSSHSTDTLSSLKMNGLSTSTEELSSNEESESRDELSIEEEEEGVVRRGVTTRSRSQRKRRLGDQEGMAVGRVVTRSTTKRLRRLSMSDEDEEDELEEEVIPRVSHIVTRTGRTVKPTIKY